MIQDWGIVTLQALQGLWQGFLDFIPVLIGAIIVFVIGWFIACGVGKLITEILKKLKFNRIFEKGVWKEALEKAEFKVDASGFIGAICKWILAIVFLLASIEILGFVQFADFLKNVIGWLPNLIVATAIFVVAAIVAEFLEKIVRASVEGIRVGYGHLMGVIVKWSVWIFAIIAILMQLGIAKELIMTLFTGTVALIVISGGIAFGLGGKEVAGELLRDLQKKLKG